MSLTEARRNAKEVRGLVVAGNLGPSTTQSFPEARERFLEDSRMRTKPSTYAEYKRLLHKHFTWKKGLASITRSDIMEAVTAVRDHLSLEQHCFVAIRTLMNWAVRHGHLAASPVPKMRFQTVSRSCILTDDKLKAIWHRAKEIGYPFGTIVRLLILTGQRRGEIVSLRRSWIIHDAITFPATITKNKREHAIPIGPLTKEIIETIRVETDLLFLARGKPDLPFNGWSKAKLEFGTPLAISDFTLHDLRRTYSSNLAKLGVPIHVTEKLLNHVSGSLSGVAGVYNCYS